MNNVFILPYTENEYIIYLPVQGILVRGNKGAVNLFNRAINGDEEAAKKFGLTPAELSKIRMNDDLKSPHPLKHCLFMPTSVSLFLTTGCSMKCIYCYASAGDSFKRIKMEFVEAALNEIIGNITRLGKKIMPVNYHGGGDIGVIWDLVEETTERVNKIASENGIKPFINVGLNGILSDRQRKWIAEHTDTATVSLDGDSDIQNLQRPLKNGSGSFDTVHKTLKYFDSVGYNYALRATVTSKSVESLDRIITFFCENYGARKIKMEPVFLHGRAAANMIGMPPAEDFVKYFLQAGKIAAKYGRELLYSGARFDTVTDVFCQAAGNSFGVTPDGNITSCYEVLEKDHPLAEKFFYGRIENGIIRIEQEKLDSLGNLTVHDKEKCTNCFAKFHCAGDCPVKSMLEETNEDISGYRCYINREITKAQLLRSIK